MLRQSLHRDTMLERINRELGLGHSQSERQTQRQVAYLRIMSSHQAARTTAVIDRTYAEVVA